VGTFYSLAAADAWEESHYPLGPPNNFCSAFSTNGVIGSPPVGYTYGVETIYGLRDTLSITRYSNGTPPCASTDNSSVFENFDVQRTVQCPVGWATTYQATPLIGPKCTPPTSPSPNLFKQLGCPTCGAALNSGGADPGSGRLVKGNPVDVANGNKYQEEVDYVGAGNDPLKFARSYNGLVGYYQGTVISVDPNFHPRVNVDGKNYCGAERAPTSVILGHELGHAVRGDTVENPQIEWANIYENENPIRQQLNLPIRTALAPVPW
jgi:hypothetical protein